MIEAAKSNVRIKRKHTGKVVLQLLREDTLVVVDRGNPCDYNIDDDGDLQIWPFSNQPSPDFDRYRDDCRCENFEWQSYDVILQFIVPLLEHVREKQY